MEARTVELYVVVRVGCGGGACERGSSWCALIKGEPDTLSAKEATSNLLLLGFGSFLYG